MRLVRWTPRPANIEEFLIRSVRPLIREPDFLRHTTGFYVSRQPAGVVWVTIYAEDAKATEAREAISRLLGEEADEPASSTDPILADALGWYRLALQQVCQAALDLLPIPKEDTQLLRVVRDAGDKRFFPDHPPADTYRALLEQRVFDRAAAYTALPRSKRDEFWSRFPEWPSHAFLSPAGHWLWNITGVE